MPTHRVTRRRAAFSLIEVVTAVVVVAVLATVLVSGVNPETPNDSLRYSTAADRLNKLAYAIAGYEPSRAPRSFHQVVGVYPGQLSDLTTQISTAGKNICGNSYTGPLTTAGTNLYKWANAANPFYSSQLLTAGTPIAPGFTVQNTLVLKTFPAANAGSSSENTLIIRMPSVVLRDAKGLDQAVDGTVDGAVGTIRYSSTDPTVVDYYIPVSVTNNVSLPNC